MLPFNASEYTTKTTGFHSIPSSTERKQHNAIQYLEAQNKNKTFFTQYLWPQNKKQHISIQYLRAQNQKKTNPFPLKTLDHRTTTHYHSIPFILLVCSTPWKQISKHKTHKSFFFFDLMHEQLFLTTFQLWQSKTNTHKKALTCT